MRVPIDQPRRNHLPGRDNLLPRRVPAFNLRAWANRNNASVSDSNRTVIKNAARDLSWIPELDAMNDSDRWLICSEGRPKLMSWLIFAPT